MPITDLIQDRGRGPELAGTRITVYHLLPSLLDPLVTEAELCRVYDLTAEQVAAARAYVLGHADTVLARHLEIEAKLTEGNPPEVREQAQRAKATLQQFRHWLDKQAARNHAENETEERAGQFPTFREWLAAHEPK